MKGKVTYFYNNNMKRNSFFFLLYEQFKAYIFLSYPSHLYETILSV